MLSHRRAAHAAPFRRCLVAFVAMLVANSAVAVDRLVPSQYATIQAAIDAAVAGDTVLVAPGAYNERLDLKGKAITLKGQNGYTQTILDPLGGAGYLLLAQTGETLAGTVVDGFSFRNSPTGGMKVVSAGVTVKNCRFLGNGAAQGPAMWLQAGNVLVDNTQFVSNVASDRGGAIYAKATTALRLNNCVFNSNKSTGTRGGAIYAESSTIDFDGTSFLNNREEAGDESYGGAIFLLTCSGTMDYCTFTGNTASSSLKSYGGSLYFDSSSPTVRNVTFTNCLAYTNRGGHSNPDSEAHGGSVFLVNGSSSAFWDCAWTGPKAESTGNFGGGCNNNTSGLRARGGAIHGRDSCNFALRRCSVSGGVARAAGSGGSGQCGCCNWYTGYVSCYAGGGALWVKKSSPYLDDCHFSGCSAQDAATGSVNGAASYAGVLWTEDLASPTILRTRFTNNTTRYGGAFFLTGQSSPFTSDCSFIGNNGTIQGGVMYSEHSIPNFADSLFQDNTSPSGSVAFSTSSSSNYPAIGTSVFCGNLGTDMVGTWYNDPGNILLDACPEDCNGNGTNDRWDILGGVALDCNGNLTPDSCDISANPAIDCNDDGVPDSCQSATPGFGDCDGDGVVDACEPDCNANGLADVCEIRNGSVPDCNANGIPDGCDLVNGRGADCDSNGVPDTCQPDCDSDGQPNACEIAAGAADCDGNGVPDACQLASGDANGDGVLDACQTVAFENLEVEIKPIVGSIAGLPSTAVCWRVYAKLSSATASVTGIFGDTSDPLSIQATGGFFQSPAGANVASDIPCGSTVPSVAYDSYLTVGGQCANEVDVVVTGIDFTAFNANGGISTANGIAFITPGSPAGVAGKDRRVLLMQLTTKNGVKPTTSFNLIGDNADGTEWFAYGLPLPNPTLVDCNGNSIHDAIDIGTGTSRDCNRTGVPDECEYANANADCDADGTVDLCEIFSGAEIDLNDNGIPDDCECLGDVTGDGVVNVYDIIAVIVLWGDPNPGAADLNGDGVVNGVDVSLVLTGWGYCL